MNLADFFAMGGYGFYVWGAYTVTVALIALEIMVVRARYRAARLALEAAESAG